MAWVTMTKIGIAGTAVVTQEAFDATWAGLGWTLVPPADPSTLPVPMEWHGEWDSAIQYYIGDTVSRGNLLYVALRPTKNEAPEATVASWDAITTITTGALTDGGSP